MFEAERKEEMEGRRRATVTTSTMLIGYDWRAYSTMTES